MNREVKNTAIDRKNLSSIQNFGVDSFKEIWSTYNKTTKEFESLNAMELPNGVLAKHTKDSTSTLTFIPDVKIKEVKDTRGVIEARTLVTL
tara:strand:- start:1768 stop:2040 length:273 start_codon:yes stop_codon:yes gene_type:complete